MLLLGVEKVRTGARAELRRHHLRHRPHRRRAQRQHPAAALFGVPHRQRHQQHHLEELRGHRQAPGGGLDRAAVARRQPPRLPRARHHARLFRALQLPPRTRPGVRLRRAVQGPVRRRDRRRRGAGARLQGRRPDRRRARPRLGVVRRARRQAVPRRRHPGQDRHAGRPHRARQPGGHRGDPRRLAERRAACRARACRPTRCARWTSKPKAITAALVGLKSKLATFQLQRAINEYAQEPLSAIMPGAALQELWGLVGTAETALSAVSAMVVATALLGMVTMILTTLNERRREMAILRSVGARPATILGLLAGRGRAADAGRRRARRRAALRRACRRCGPGSTPTYGLHLDDRSRRRSASG